jgi:hypothetical protein
MCGLKMGRWRIGREVGKIVEEGGTGGRRGGASEGDGEKD